MFVVSIFNWKEFCFDAVVSVGCNASRLYYNFETHTAFNTWTVYIWDTVACFQKMSRFFNTGMVGEVWRAWYLGSTRFEIFVCFLWECGDAPYLLPTLPKHFGDFNTVGLAMFCLPFSFQSKLLYKEPPRSILTLQKWIRTGAKRKPKQRTTPCHMPPHLAVKKKRMISPLSFIISTCHCWAPGPEGILHELCKPQEAYNAAEQAVKGCLKLALQILSDSEPIRRYRNVLKKLGIPFTKNNPK